MSSRKWLDNAFWENDQKDDMSCILELEDDAGRQTRQVMRLKKFDKDGDPNPDFEEVVEVLGEELIDKNTEERHTRKKAEKEAKFAAKKAAAAAAKARGKGKDGTGGSDAVPGGG